MTAVRETENGFVELEGYIDMDAGFGQVGKVEHSSGIGKPKKPPIKTEMQRDDSVCELQKKIFAEPLHRDDSLAFRESCKMSRALRFRGNRVQDMNAANAALHNQGPQSARDGFYFRRFRHVGTDRFESQRWFQSQGMFARFRFGGIAKGRDDGFAFIPIGELIRIVAAAELTGFARGD